MPKSAQKKSAARASASRKTAATNRSGPRLAASNGKVIEDVAPEVKPAPVVKLSAKDRVAADVQALTTAPAKRDTSFVIPDYDTLRAKAAEAMGVDFVARTVDSAADKVLADWAKRKAGAAHGHVFVIHPLALHVQPGLNSRNFFDEDMIDRVAELTDMVQNGVNTPLEVSHNGEKWIIVGGEGRWRGVLHNHILKASDPTRKAPVGIKVMLENPGTNDAKRHLNVFLGNASKTMKPIEIAQKMLDSFNSGMSIEDIAAYIGKPDQAGINQVESYIGMCEMPEAVLKVVRSGMIAMTLAFQWWKEAEKDTAKTMARISAAEKVMLSKKAKHIMPKHDEAASEAETTGEPSGDTTTTVRTVTRKATANAEGAVKTLDMIATNRPVSGSVKVEDGFLVWSHKVPIEAAVVQFQRTGWSDELPADAKDAA